MERIVAIASLALVLGACGEPPLQPTESHPINPRPGRDKSTEEEELTSTSASDDDGGTTEEAPPARVRCDRSSPFGAPEPVAGLPGDEHLATPRLSADEKTMYFTRRVHGVAKLHRAVRASLTEPFGPVEPLDEQTSDSKDNDPSVSADGLTLWFSSERNAGRGDDLFFATRAAPNERFGPPVPVPVVNTDGDEQHPYFRASASELWFSSSRDGQWSIFVARKTTSGFSAPRRVEELVSSAPTRQPMITEDGLDIVFASEREGGKGEGDIWTAHRDVATSPFGPPRPLAEINSSGNEFAGWLSADGCRIYFSSDRHRSGRQKIFFATREPVTK